MPRAARLPSCAAVTTNSPPIASPPAQTFGLPVAPPRGLDLKRLAEAVRRDKKVRAGAVRVALPERIGRMPQRQDPSIPIDARLELLPFLLRN